MLAHPTLDHLNTLGLHGPSVFTAWPKASRNSNTGPKTRGLDNAEWLGLLLEYELTLRRQKQFETRARVAKLRHTASIEDVNYHDARAGSTARCFSSSPLATGSPSAAICSITGASPALGKSWLACALGHKACRENMSVLYTRMRPGCSRTLPSRTAMRATPGCSAEIFRQADLTPLLHKARSSRAPGGARRPEFSALGHEALVAVGMPPIPDWKQGIARYLDARAAQTEASVRT